jgi:hypothetical protein
MYLSNQQEEHEKKEIKLPLSHDRSIFHIRRPILKPLTLERDIRRGTFYYGRSIEITRV